MIGELTLAGIVVIVGGYGSGKTEVAINLAADQSAMGRKVQIADLDLVNLYFRTRQARHTLAALGIEMILPPDDLLEADLPILSPKVHGLIRHPAELAILDVGGDHVGATVLGALADAFNQTSHPVSIWQVVNPLRPETQTVDQCLAMRRSIETSARLSVTGWIGNTHLMAETTLDHILAGYELLNSLARSSGLPLVLMTMGHDLMAGADVSVFACPLLPIRRQLVPPWEKAQPLGPRDAGGKGA